MSTYHRREFLTASLAVATAAALNADTPRARFPTQARERLSVATYPFRNRIAAPASEHRPARSGMTLEKFAQTVKPKLNVTGIEPWSPHFQSTDPEYIRSLRRSFESAGLHVVNIPVDARVHPCGTSAERTEALNVWRKWVDTAVLLGSPSVRVHLPHAKGSDNVNCAVSALTELAKYGAPKNIVINLENDDPTSEPPERIVKVIQAVNNPFLCALPDFCNSMLIHNDQAYNNEALQRLFPLAFNVSHVKDMEKDEDKVYRVDVDQIFAIARRADYKGYFSMEWEGTGDDYQGTQKLIEASLKNLG